MIQQVLGAAALGFVCIASHAVAAADARIGETLAKRWCGGCHLVERAQKGPTTEAPPFATVAESPGFDAGKLALFLLDPHPKMPNMQLTRNEAADLAAYIATLR